MGQSLGHDLRVYKKDMDRGLQKLDDTAGLYLFESEPLHLGISNNFVTLWFNSLPMRKLILICLVYAYAHTPEPNACCHFSHLVDGIQQSPSSRPLHCIKLLTQSKASVVVTVSYSNMTDDVYVNKFEYNGDQSKSINIICKTLPIGFDNANIYKAEIEQVESNDDVWQSKGVLLQESPSGF